MHTLVEKIIAHGKTRKEVSDKLKRMGFLIDQSNIAKWEKMDNPSPKMTLRFATALSLLDKAKGMNDSLDGLKKIGDFVRTIQTLHLAGREIGDWDLMPILRTLTEAGITHFTLRNLADALTFSVARGEFLSPESVPSLLSFLGTLER